MKTIKGDLDNALTIEYKHIATDRDRSKSLLSQASTFINYHFEDKNGVKFTVSTGYFGRNDYPGYYKRTSCDYPEALLYAERDALEEVLQSSLPIEWYRNEYTTIIVIEISSYQELEQVAEIIEKALNAVTPFPIRHGSYAVLNDDAYHGFELPAIRVVSCGPESIDWSLGFFRFPYEGDAILSYSEILESMQNECVELTKEGRLDMVNMFPDGIPREDRFAYPATEINTIYVNDERLVLSELSDESAMEFSFKYIEQSKVYAAYAKTIFYSDGFKDLVNMLGGDYEYFVSGETRVTTWTIGDDIWRTESPDFAGLPENLPITKNGELLCTLHDRMYTLSDLELMIDVTAEVNQWDAAIYLK